VWGWKIKTTPQNRMTTRRITPLVFTQSRRFFGYKFRRQMPIGAYIVDFACFKAKLIIELDGGQHDEKGIFQERAFNGKAGMSCDSGITNSGKRRGVDGYFETLQA
jgi:hypothetical protein